MTGTPGVTCADVRVTPEKSISGGILLMIWRPKFGQIVQLWYVRRVRKSVGHHAEVGMVRAFGNGKGPKNCLVDLGYMQIIVPCGNLREI